MLMILHVSAIALARDFGKLCRLGWKPWLAANLALPFIEGMAETFSRAPFSYFADLGARQLLAAYFVCAVVTYRMQGWTDATRRLRFRITPRKGTFIAATLVAFAIIWLAQEPTVRLLAALFPPPPGSTPKEMLPTWLAMRWIAAPVSLLPLFLLPFVLILSPTIVDGGTGTLKRAIRYADHVYMKLLGLIAVLALLMWGVNYANSSLRLLAAIHPALPALPSIFIEIARYAVYGFAAIALCFIYERAKASESMSMRVIREPAPTAP